MSKMKILAMALGSVALPRGFEGGSTAGWKMDGDKIAVQDGNPVWINSDGSESVLKGDTISALRNEAKTWRERAQENQAKLKDFEGIDAAAARAALETVGKIDQKQLIDAGKVDEVRNAVKSEYETKLAEYETNLKNATARIDSMTLDAAFSSSEFIRDNIAIPAEMFRSHFGQFFKVEDGKITAYDRAGNRIMSKKSIGEFADFNESVELLVDGYSQKDAILKAPEHRGSGSNGGAANRGTGRVLRRADFEALTPAKQAEMASLMGKGELNIVD